MNIAIDTNIILEDRLFKSKYYEMLYDYLDKTDSNFVLPEVVLS